jgi:hypothetical protein
MRKKRFSRQRMQHLGQRRMHALAQAGSKNDDIQFGHINEGYLEIVTAAFFCRRRTKGAINAGEASMTTQTSNLDNVIYHIADYEAKATAY